MQGNNDKNQSGWGVFGAFRSGNDMHGDSRGSFSVLILFFFLLGLGGAGYYTYTYVQGATVINKTLSGGVDLESGLVAYWTFDGSDTTTTAATDISGNGNNGVIATPANPIKPTIGKVGQGLEFDGDTSGQVITVAANASHEDLSAYTLSAWVKPGLTGSDMLIAKGSGSSDADNGFLWRLLSTGAMSFTYSYSVTDIFRVTAASMVLGDAWNFVTLVWDGSTTATNIRMYVNGIEVSYGSATNGSGSRVSDSGQSIRIGNNASGSAVLDAVIDDVRIYNRILSTAEIQALYKLGEGSKVNISETPTNLETGLVGHWTFDGPDMIVATATDVSGNGNDGTLTNGPSRVMGKIGQGLSFDGVDDYIYIKSSASHSNLGPMTISAWQYVEQSADFGIDVMTKISGGAVISFLFRTYWSAPAGRVEFVSKFGSQNLQITSAGSSVAKGRWQHVVMTWDGTASSSGAAIYVDGQEVPSYQTLTDGVGARPDDSTYPLYISQNGTNRLDGKLDDVRLYNRVLSSDEVAQLYMLGGGSSVKICREESVQDADGNWYDTIAIGSQCWLDRNMNVGTRIDASAGAQTDNGTIEKYCYSNSDDNCIANNPNKPDGGLYEWLEAVQYVTSEGAKGICPVGFHIPTDAEWHTLEKFLTDSGGGCVQSRNTYGCVPAGSRLKSEGDLAFEANLAGLTTGTVNSSRGSFGSYWSSTWTGSVSYYRIFSSVETGIRRLSYGTGRGLSVRCIQD